MNLPDITKFMVIDAKKHIVSFLGFLLKTLIGIVLGCAVFLFFVPAFAMASSRNLFFPTGYAYYFAAAPVFLAAILISHLTGSFIQKN